MTSRLVESQRSCTRSASNALIVVPRWLQRAAKCVHILTPCPISLTAVSGKVTLAVLTSQIINHIVNS
ncbi:hypothetical protein NOCA2270167 [metagenome]|uniref:Uncharacterized protein n=1 Tax=metagenome TaxID=256318 RepID=A0A2P2C455_9ZZZZ